VDAADNRTVGAARDNGRHWGTILSAMMEVAVMAAAVAAAVVAAAVVVMVMVVAPPPAR
jgi:hypothetical protein